MILYRSQGSPQNYKDLVFYDPDNQVKFIIHPGNMEYQRGWNGGWMAIGIPPDDSGFDKEPFQLGDMLIEIIVGTDQADNITTVQLDKEEDDGNATNEVNTKGEEV